ncbi:Sec63 Brl domain-containing protein [Zopfochytrium polystomum]|nr:Sec63 Brl domain-containing protein [Zopfochytrium polystomum]
MPPKRGRGGGRGRGGFSSSFSSFSSQYEDTLSSPGFSYRGSSIRQPLTRGRGRATTTPSLRGRFPSMSLEAPHASTSSTAASSSLDHDRRRIRLDDPPLRPGQPSNKSFFNSPPYITPTRIGQDSFSPSRGRSGSSSLFPTPLRSPKSLAHPPPGQGPFLPASRSGESHFVCRTTTINARPATGVFDEADEADLLQSPLRYRNRESLLGFGEFSESAEGEYTEPADEDADDDISFKVDTEDHFILESVESHGNLDPNNIWGSREDNIENQFGYESFEEEPQSLGRVDPTVPYETRPSQAQHLSMNPQRVPTHVGAFRQDSRLVGPSTSRFSREPLKSVSELPDRLRHLFPFSCFNAVQSQCFDVAFGSDRNLVVSAPTGSGKTVIMELAISRMLLNFTGDNSKAIYIAPTKALCSERCADWKRKFRTLGISCNELTGDSDYGSLREIQQSTLMQKWDSMTRRWRDYRQLMSLVRLIMIDEVHVLNEPRRGATLEVIISRMRTVNKEMQSDFSGQFREVSRGGLRIVALSATVPNVSDIAEWLRGSSEGEGPADVRVFGEEYRPVQLLRKVVAFASKMNTTSFQYDQSLDFKLMDLVKEFSNGKPTLVFCSTRKSALSAASRLAIEAETSGRAHPFIANEIQLVLAGVAVHHGGLNLSDRRIIEDNFLKGIITCICATSTLSVGERQQYVNGQFSEYSELDVMQMMGRAGRPQFDDSGTVVIMTTLERKSWYENLVSGNETVESSLHENLIEHLNAEAVLGTIESVETAISWLQSSFLYVRIRKNPKRYKLASSDNQKNSTREQLEAICVKDLDLLAEAHLIDLNTSDNSLNATDYGRAMAKYYVRFETARDIINLRRSPSIREVLQCLCRGRELSDIKFRSDKGQLNELNKSILLPVHGKVKTPADKISILIQCSLGSVPILEPKFQASMATDTNLIFQHALRISRCIVEMMCTKNDFAGLRSSLELSGSQHLKQIEGIGPTLMKHLETAGIRSFAHVLSTPPDQLEGILNRGRLFGNKLHDQVRTLPKLTMDLSEPRMPKGVLDVNFVVSLRLENADVAKTFGKRGPFYAFFAAGTSENDLKEYKRIQVKNLKSSQIINVSVTTQRRDITLICVSGVGLTVTKMAIVKGNPAAADEAPFVTAKSLLQRQKSSQPLAGQTGASANLRSKDADSEKEFENAFNDGIDWDQAMTGIDESMVSVVKPVASPISPYLPEGRVPCAHSCKRKDLCEHMCCKKGVPAKTAKKRKTLQHPQSDSVGYTDSNVPATIQEKIISSSRFEKLAKQSPNAGFEQDHRLSESDDDIPLKRKKVRRVIQPLSSLSDVHPEIDDDGLDVAEMPPSATDTPSGNPVLGVADSGEKDLETDAETKATALDDKRTSLTISPPLFSPPPPDDADFDFLLAVAEAEEVAKKSTEKPVLQSVRFSEKDQVFETTPSSFIRDIASPLTREPRPIDFSHISRNSNLVIATSRNPELTRLNELHAKTSVSFGSKPWLRPTSADSSMPPRTRNGLDTGEIEKLSKASATTRDDNLLALNRLHDQVSARPAAAKFSVSGKAVDDLIPGASVKPVDWDHPRTLPEEAFYRVCRHWRTFP